MLKQTGISQLSLKRKQKMQLNNSRLSERQQQMNMSVKMGGNSMAESIFTDSEDEYNLSIFETLSKSKQKEEKYGDPVETMPEDILEKKFNQEHSQSLSYGLCYLNPQYFISLVPTKLNPTADQKLLLSNSEKYYKKNERIISQWRNKEIMMNFHEGQSKLISKRFTNEQENFYIQTFNDYII
eukprot:TRINITY_DN5780_c0_g1_i1.p1 TRINITY_DN5780_c0_g1~~TRINITY_DN5780_c0_g1_i1.p1  ORF type:complete len:183 (+),score=28.48 TRINITY_DN5780_c0_g1_i1:54-602(+)